MSAKKILLTFRMMNDEAVREIKSNCKANSKSNVLDKYIDGKLSISAFRIYMYFSKNKTLMWKNEQKEKTVTPKKASFAYKA